MLLPDSPAPVREKEVCHPGQVTLIDTSSMRIQTLNMMGFKTALETADLHVRIHVHVSHTHASAHITKSADK